MSPLQEDTAVVMAAVSCGLEVVRYDAVEITDTSAVAAAGMICKACKRPDYSRIRKALIGGTDVPGAKLQGVEYILKRK